MKGLAEFSAVLLIVAAVASLVVFQGDEPLLVAGVVAILVLVGAGVYLPYRRAKLQKKERLKPMKDPPEDGVPNTEC